MTIALVTATAAGRAAAAELSSRWPDTRTYPVAEIGVAWRECQALVCFLAVGAAVRLLAPLLAGKDVDPGVVCVDEARRFAVAVLGGHGGGANALAERAADALGGTAVLTTGTDATGLAGLDQLGWPVHGDIAAVTRAMLDGAEVTLTADASWPLPPLPVVVAPTPIPPSIVVTDRLVDLPGPVVLLRPPSLVVGVGASSGVPRAEVLGLIRESLATGGLAAESIRELSTVDLKATEPGIVAAAGELGVPLLTHPAQTLATVDVPDPSEVVRAAVGTPSVAEAAALASGGELIVPKRKSAHATVAVARVRPRGRLAVVGLGPGAADLTTPRATAELRRASVIVGLDQYVDRVRGVLRPGTRVAASGLGDEERRAGLAVELARAGHAVALLGSGDAGVYGMASPALDAADGSFDVVGVPGVTAMLAAAAALGAPLGHDHAAISLSDLHTPWPVIEQRVRAAATGDLVVAFYNPRSRGRDWQLGAALALLAKERAPDTPVGVVTNASTPGQTLHVSTLSTVDVELVGMSSLVVVGSSSSRIVAGRFVTPRGYRWR